MDELRRTLQAAAEAPAEIDHAALRPRVRRIRRRRYVGALVGVLAAATVMVGVLQRTAPVAQVRLADEPEDRRGAAVAEPATAWRVVAAEGPLAPRWGAVSAWAGDQVLVWGGYSGAGTADEGPADDGAAYDPANDRWRPLAPSPLPGLRDAPSLWTGDELWILGGEGGPNGYERIRSAAAYDPDADAWRSLPDTPGRVVSVAWSERAQMAVVLAVVPDGDEVSAWVLPAGGGAWRGLPELPEPPRARGGADPVVTTAVVEAQAHVVTDAGANVIDLLAPDGWRALEPAPLPDDVTAIAAAPLDSGLLVVAGASSAMHLPAGDDAAWRPLPPSPVAVTDTADPRIVDVGDGVVLVDTVRRRSAVFDPDAERWSLLPALPLERRAEAAVAVGDGPAQTAPMVFVWGGARADNLPFGDGAILTIADD